MGQAQVMVKGLVEVAVQVGAKFGVLSWWAVEKETKLMLNLTLVEIKVEVELGKRKVSPSDAPPVTNTRYLK